MRRRAEKFLVHNYGHGGAGITMSWGCAQQVHDIVSAPCRHVTRHHGGGPRCRRDGLDGGDVADRTRTRVTIYSDRKPVDTTSHKAGGQWAVSVVEYAREQELKKILTDSYTRFRCELGPEFGVYERSNYTHERTKNFDIVLQLCPGLIAEPNPLTRMPFQGHTKPGYEYRTLLIEPPVFLARLESDLRQRGAAFVERHFDSRADILATVPHHVIVNCTGMGAKNLFNDAEMQPIKGQLAMLPAQNNLAYLYSGDGYLFPRSDHVVIGGTYEENVADETVSQTVCKNVVKYMEAHFGVVPPMPMPRIHINHPDHAAVYDPVLPHGPAKPSVNV